MSGLVALLASKEYQVTIRPKEDGASFFIGKETVVIL
jgi:hypothetical protein